MPTAPAADLSKLPALTFAHFGDEDRRVNDRRAQTVTKHIPPAIISPSCSGHGRIMLGGTPVRTFL